MCHSQCREGSQSCSSFKICGRRRQRLRCSGIGVLSQLVERLGKFKGKRQFAPNNRLETMCCRMSSSHIRFGKTCYLKEPRSYLT